VNESCIEGRGDRAAIDHNLSADLVTAIITKPFDVETLISAARSCLDTD